jgi:hypothetical protein
MTFPELNLQPSGLQRSASTNYARVCPIICLYMYGLANNFCSTNVMQKNVTNLQTLRYDCCVKAYFKCKESSSNKLTMRITRSLKFWPSITCSSIKRIFHQHDLICTPLNIHISMIKSDPREYSSKHRPGTPDERIQGYLTFSLQCVCVVFFYIYLSDCGNILLAPATIRLAHTHTHTHTQKKKNLLLLLMILIIYEHNDTDLETNHTWKHL